ncbi:MAG: CAP domain-containing protein [Mycolicibacterium sp.]|uniref:CAP domain-containing protein n=1 Tax=Mycolicibacterium sp. TaxID=2320850 RepID=UPI003D1256C6
MTKIKLAGIFAGCTALATLGLNVDIAARADNLAAGLHSGVNQHRQACGAIGSNPQLTAAAQRHADDMLNNGTFSHTGSDGSSPQARITESGYGGATSTGEIVYWGTGSAGTPSAALDFWMASPGHRAIILNCAFTEAGFATARNGNLMTAVVDFAKQ